MPDRRDRWFAAKRVLIGDAAFGPDDREKGGLAGRLLEPQCATVAMLGRGDAATNYGAGRGSDRVAVTSSRKRRARVMDP
jgi:hypothetical protein